MAGMLGEFKKFVSRGNVVDLAVGVIIGAAFGAIVTSLVNDILMPPIGILLGNVDFADLFLVLKEGTAPKPYPTVAAAKAVGAVTLNYGLFVNNVITFLINAAAIFLVVRGINRLRPEPPPAPAPPATRPCPFCLSTIPAGAVRCPQCTSDLKTAR